MRHEWRQILCDPITGAELIEVWQSQERRFTRPLAGGAGAMTAAGRIDLDNPAAPIMKGPNAIERLEKLLKVYRDGELLGVLDLTAGEPAGDATAQTFTYAAAGPLITRINGRQLGASTAGYSKYSATVQGRLTRIAVDVLREINDAFWSGISSRTYEAVDDGVPNGYVEKLYFKRAGELMMELSQQLGGFDFDIEPEEPHEAPDQLEVGLQIGSLRTYASRGSQQPLAIFEYGSGKRNMASWRGPIDATGMANFLTHLAPGFPDSVEAGVTPAVNAANLNTLYRRPRHDVVQADLQPPNMRQMLVNEHARIRGYPRETIFITPAPDADVTYGEHYREGDLVEARARTYRGRVEFDALFRIYGVDFTVDNMGVESVELALVNEATQL